MESALRTCHSLRLKLPSGRLAGLVLKICQDVEQNGKERERKNCCVVSLSCDEVLAVIVFVDLQYDKRLCSFLDKYDRAFIVAADNVGSKQFQDIRRVR